MQTLALKHNGNKITWLHGPGTIAPLVTALRGSPGWAGEEREEHITLIMEGTPQQIGEQLSHLTRLLRQSARWVHDGVGEAVQLCIVPYAGSEEYTSLVIGGRVTLPAADTCAWQNGRAQVEMLLLRVDAWESAEQTLTSASPVGNGGIVVHNHQDQEHGNFVDVSGEDLRGSLPGLVHLEAEFADGLGDLITGIFGQVLEAEAAEGETPVSAEEASAGAYVSKTVVPSPASAVLNWDLSADDLIDWEPGEMIPFVRFFSAPGPYTDAQVYWRVSSQGTVWESERQPLGSPLLQELPALDLFSGLRSGNFAPLQLALMLQGPAIYHLEIDVVHFFHVGQLRRYLARGTLTGGGILVDDGGWVVTRMSEGNACLVSHGAVGQPLALEPGRDQRLYFLHSGGIEDTLRIQLWYRPRWQEI